MDRFWWFLRYQGRSFINPTGTTLLGRLLPFRPGSLGRAGEETSRFAESPHLSLLELKVSVGETSEPWKEAWPPFQRNWHGMFMDAEDYFHVLWFIVDRKLVFCLEAHLLILLSWKIENTCELYVAMYPFLEITRAHPHSWVSQGPGQRFAALRKSDSSQWLLITGSIVRVTLSNPRVTT